MKDILEILKAAGLEVTAEQKTAITKSVNESYRGVEELEKKKNRILELEKQNGEMSNQIKTFDGDKTKLEELQKKVADFERAEIKRKEEQQAAELDKAMRERFTPLRGEREYFNKYAEKETYENFKTALADKANAGKSDVDIYAAITKDKDIYRPKEKFINPPVGGKTDPGADDVAKARAVMGLKTNKGD